MPADEEWQPALQYRRGKAEPDLDEETWRLVRLSRDVRQRREDTERRLRARLSGYRPIDEVMQAAEDRQVNGNGKLPWPAEWYRLAEKAARNPSPKRPRYDRRSQITDD
jgi:hypothetical protein